jgi:hypothetical protein
MQTSSLDMLENFVFHDCRRRKLKFSQKGVHEAFLVSLFELPSMKCHNGAVGGCPISCAPRLNTLPLFSLVVKHKAQFMRTFENTSAETLEHRVLFQVPSALVCHPHMHFRLQCNFIQLCFSY